MGRVRVLRALVLLPCLAMPQRGFALDPGKTIFQNNCRSWTRQNGFPANGVNRIVQTRDGYLWLGTAMGLIRFDGVDFQIQDLSGASRIRSPIFEGLSPSRHGGLWFGLKYGAFGYSDGKEVSLLGKEEWGGINLNVHAILESTNGDVWVASETQAARLVRGKAFQPILPGLDSQEHCDVTSLYEDTHGRIWLGTTRQGLFYWQNEKLTNFPDSSLNSIVISCVVEDNRGQIWVGTERGLLCYDAKFQKQPLPWPWYATRALYADRQGAVWAGTSGGGLARYVGNAITLFRKADGLADDFVTAIAEDTEGSLWVGTRSGLSQLSDVKLPTFGKTEGLTAEVNVAVECSRNGGLWVATSDGFTYFDSSPYPATYSTNIGLHSAYLTGVFEARNGDIYLINGSLDVEVCSGGKVLARYPNTNWPTALCEDSRSVIVAVGDDLYRVGTNSFVPYTLPNGQKPELHYVFKMLADKDDSLWLATGDGIIQVTAQGSRRWAPTGVAADPKAIWITQDRDGVIWAGMAGGIARVKNGELRMLTQDNGLFDSAVYAMVPDDYGSFWLHSARGFFRVSLQSLNDFADRKTNRVTWAGYDSQSAVKSSEINQQRPSGCKTLDGRIWFPTAQGIVMIDPANLPSNAVPPQIHLDRVRANGRDLARPWNVSVPAGKGELEFHYVGLSYLAPNRITYRYRLDGYDKNWVEAGTRRSAFYTNLKPGRYRFDVIGCNEDGVWNTDGDGFALELLPHFYQTAWFFGAAVLAFGLALLGIYRWRVRRLQLAQRRLEARVEERTAQLRNEIEERKRMEQEVERVHGQLVDASRQAGQAEVATNVLHNVGNVLNSVNVSASLLQERIRGSRSAQLSKVTQLIHEHQGDLHQFLTQDERGRQLLPYLDTLAVLLGQEREGLLTEVKGLADNVGHIRDIIVMQQSYAKLSGVTEEVLLPELVESALKMNSGAFQRHAVKTLRDFDEVPPVTLDKHRLLQILVNLLNNARSACDEANQPDKHVQVRIKRSGLEGVRIEVADNGVGIAPENLTRIFGHGFTTRKNGHGFGLHSAALAAKEMGGSLTARSDGAGKGATFIVELPLLPANSNQPAE